jgi:tRNA nucleotidyltransferase/poly(A) polymerase
MWTEEVDFLFKILNKKRDDIRLVGGCVRDLLLNKKINDYDFATKHTPNKVIEILQENNIKYKEIGVKYGTVTAIVKGKKFEITTLRNDINQRGRDTDVEFIQGYEGDASRRDFTFNALYLDSNFKIYDYFGGREDLKRGIIRFIKNPADRILEDSLRILRFFRFFCCYAHTPDFESFKACKKYVHFIKNLSTDRITHEFFKILGANYPVKTLKIMDKCGALGYILGGIEPMSFGNLEIFYSIKKYLDFEYDPIFGLALILSKNNEDIRLNLTLKRSEKRFLTLVKKYELKSISNPIIKELKIALKNDNYIFDAIIMIYLCNNFTGFEEIKNYWNYKKSIILYPKN